MFADAQKKEVQSGLQVAVLSEKHRQDLWTYLVGRPKDQVLLIATDRNYLQEVLNRMRSTPADVAFPKHLPEWQHVDTSAAIWAIRHFDKADAREDRTSPLNPNRFPEESDSRAIGLTFCYHKSDKRRVRIKYLTTNPRSLDFVRINWSLAGGTVPKVRRVAADVVEAEHVLTNVRVSAYFLLILLGGFGHPILL